MRWPPYGNSDHCKRVGRGLANLFYKRKTIKAELFDTCRPAARSYLPAEVKARRRKRNTGVRICPKPRICDFRLGAHELHVENQVVAEFDRRPFRVEQPIAVIDQRSKAVLSFVRLESAAVEQFLKCRHRGNLCWRPTNAGPRAGFSTWFGGRPKHQHRDTGWPIGFGFRPDPGVTVTFS